MTAHLKFTVTSPFAALCITSTLLIASAPNVALAWGSCKHRAPLAANADVSGAKRVVVAAAAGDLRIEASANAAQLQARGDACAPTAELLAAIKLNVRRQDDAIYVETLLPEPAKGGWTGDSPTLDVTLTLPANLPVDVTDSSGDVTVRNVAALTLRDSSGDIDISGTRGNVELEDSSGDIRVTESGANLHIGTDSSGDIQIDGVRGNVDVDRDSSGDIRAAHVGGSLRIGADSSGDIVASDVKGSFTVVEDGGGDVDYARIGGAVDIPEEKRK